MSSSVRKTVSSRRSFVSSPPGDETLPALHRRRGDPAGGSGTSAIKIPVGAGNLPACSCCRPSRHSWCISPSAMKAWMFRGLRADGRRSGLGVGWDRWSGAATSRRARRTSTIARGAARWRRPCVIWGWGYHDALRRACAPARLPNRLPGPILFWHLGRKAAGVDAEINERVNDGSADERGDDDYQRF
jgi:hypothetical protein